MSGRDFDPVVLRQKYAENRNILAHLREARKLDVNDERAVMVAYDLQAGSYVARLESDPAVAEQHRASATAFARLFDDLGVVSLLDAGTGEATMLASILGQMRQPPADIHGFDISFSRLLVGQRWLSRQGFVSARLFAGSLTQVPVLADTFDTVFTNHALEPNRGREKEIIAELYRVCRRYLILREPSWELGDEATRQHIEQHRYIKGLPGVLAELGLDVIEHRRFEGDVNAANRSALTIVRKRPGDIGPNAPAAFPKIPYASPIGKGPLRFTGEAYYSADDALIFPVISGVPCLLAENGVFSTRYLEVR